MSWIGFEAFNLIINNKRFGDELLTMRSSNILPHKCLSLEKECAWWTCRWRRSVRGGKELPGELES